MIVLTAAQVAEAVSGKLTSQLDPETVVEGPVVIDSRDSVAGALFVALPGENVDGHNFIESAIEAGAAFALSQQEVQAPAVIVQDTQKALGDLARAVLARLKNINLVAVTGSVGKTTTKDLLSQLLSDLGPTIAPRGSFNNEVGMPLTVLRADTETKYLVLEMGASGIGNLDYLTSIATPDVSVVLAVGRAHLGEFGGIEAVAQAKSELVTGTDPSGTVILNSADERVIAMKEKAGDRRTVTFSPATEIDADVQALDIDMADGATASFTLSARGQTAPVALQLVGRHQVSNALAAACVALELGMSTGRVAELLSSAKPLSYGRMRVTKRSDGVQIINDAYNANPDSMSAALESLTHFSAGRTWAVLGEMLELGDESASAHFEVGARASELGIDRVVAVGKGAAQIAAGAESGSNPPELVEAVADPHGASMVLEQHLRSGDAVLIKASNGTGLWRLGDDLVRKNQEDN